MANLLLVVSGPSGSGKNTVMTHVRRTYPHVGKAVTYTTRVPRLHEVDGVDYRFVSEADFFAKVAGGKILEYEQVYNDYFYGSPADIFDDGSIKIMEMDWKGHRKYREHYKDVRIVSIFLVPPSLEEVRKRILARSSVDNLDSRMANALDQMEHADEYDYVIINDRKEKTLQEVEAVITAELLSLSRPDNLEYAHNLISQYRK